jgi:hypothetical protein
MTLAVLRSRAIDGLDAPVVQVEVHLARGLPSFTLVGLADTEVKAARERARRAGSHRARVSSHSHSSARTPSLNILRGRSRSASWPLRARSMPSGWTATSSPVS